MPERIAIGDGTYYANYKEPFRQLEGAISGYPMGELPYDVDRRLLCPYDQPEKTFLNLGAHIAKMHGMTAEEFKAEAGLNQGTALVSEQTRMLASAAAIRRDLGQRGKLNMRIQPAWVGIKGGHGRRSAQSLNSRNSCYDQVLLTAQRIQRESGRVTSSLLRKAGVSYRIIELHFGSWEAFLRRMGEDPQRSGVKRRDADLLADLRSVAAALGHTPTVSDMRRYQMAARRTYEKHFGSWVEACHRAGIEPNVPAMWLTRARTEEEDGAILAAYAVSGSYAKAAARVGISAQRATVILSHYGIGPINGAPTNHRQRLEQMNLAATLARRIAGMPEQVA